MGNRQKKVEPIPRREPLQSVADIIFSSEAKERIRQSMHLYPPGVSKRWDRIIANINIDPGPTEKDPDPLRVNIDIKILHAVLKALFNEMRFIDSEGLALSREFIPKLYDKHSVERGRKVSQIEREAKGLSDECFAYGEVDYEVYSTIFLKVTSIYGFRKASNFYDLGCGVGILRRCLFLLF
mmetsp:Transcript_25688/g.35287  ORF Transcript_25688/g.35287 Transcript_25688/m.35287 type:complete len:182 (+) Transcript_25688:8-553(+)